MTDMLVGDLGVGSSSKNWVDKTKGHQMEQRGGGSGTPRKVCLNVKCGTSSSNNWKPGWFIRSGRICELCESCGSVFEQGRFCETFHGEDAGWRTCNACKKRVHCGCVASVYSFVLLDTGGVECYTCAKKGIHGVPLNPAHRIGLPLPVPQRATDPATMRGWAESFGSKVALNVEGGMVRQPYTPAWYSPNTGAFPPVRHFPDAERAADGITIESLVKGITVRTEEAQPESKVALAPKDSYTSAENAEGDSTDGEQQAAYGSPSGFSRDAGGVVPDTGEGASLFPIQNLLGDGPSTGLTMSAGAPLRNIDNTVQGTLLGSSCGILPLAGSVRVARPPGQGRGRNQLLPRYWPRITDQELQQITSADSNATITPLFEKMLSASDAGRIGRLVLPKACAEAYFPAISQPEGLPMKIQDITGKEWVFQFRFWPNNNSRMYVLEGVTPCIQSMQLQAGDTVTFSRLDPEGKLVMGYRRAPASLTLQVDRKRGRPLGGKSKRLRLENEDSLELKTNWEEAQELLRPPPCVVPNVVTIEGHEFEEYDEPPIFTKRTIFTSRQSGEQDQWAQCDECGSWRRAPPNALVTARWTCSDNMWDQPRASCSVPQEISNDDVDHLLGLVPGEEFAVPEKSDGGATPILLEPSGGLDALANAAAHGDTARATTSPSSPARTTKHPRHRPGCTCIVCIQPPSGKGPKHKQNCLCNVCVTVKRRFKTLMLRRKKRLSEREAEGYVRRKRKDEVEISSGHKVPTDDAHKHESSGGGLQVEGPRRSDAVIADMNDISRAAAFSLAHPSSKFGDDVLVSKGQIDLNCQPEREEEPTKVATGNVGLRQLLEEATLPLDRYLKQHGMKSLFCNPAVDTSGAVRLGDGNSGKKSDEQSSSQCHDLSNEEASQTSGRAHGDTFVISNQAGAQTPVQMQPLMNLALNDSPKSSLCKFKTPEAFSSQPLNHDVETGIGKHNDVSLRGNLGCRSPIKCPEYSGDSLHSSSSKEGPLSSKEGPLSSKFEIAAPAKTAAASAGRGRQICSGCHQQIGSAAKVCRACGTSTPFGRKRTPRVAPSKQMLSTRILASSLGQDLGKVPVNQDVGKVPVSR